MRSKQKRQGQARGATLKTLRPLAPKDAGLQLFGVMCRCGKSHFQIGISQDARVLIQCTSCLYFQEIIEQPLDRATYAA